MVQWIKHWSLLMRTRIQIPRIHIKKLGGHRGICNSSFQQEEAGFVGQASWLGCLELLNSGFSKRTCLNRRTEKDLQHQPLAYIGTHTNTQVNMQTCTLLYTHHSIPSQKKAQVLNFTNNIPFLITKATVMDMMPFLLLSKGTPEIH